MAGWTTAGVPTLTTLTGNEQGSFDTETAGGVSPQTGAISVQQLAVEASMLTSNTSKTMVAGTRYFSSLQLATPKTITGLNVLVGGTGGTDGWAVSLYDNSGNLLAAAANTAVGTASQWQAFPFTTAYVLTAAELSTNGSNFFASVQSNGTTATVATFSAPVSPVLSNSATGTYGVAASITPPTTYTKSVGPLVNPYT